ncbi:MAG: uridine kinase [Actinotalea sp.]|nr:uridine kinase [Actinotalea sp.]
MTPTLSGLVALVQSRPAALGDVRLVCVDGPAGSGKTTLAAALAAALDAVVLHLDDLYEGWEGLDGVAERLDDQVLVPLGEARDGRYQRYDWVLGHFAEWIDLPVPATLVLEGCGSAARAVAGRASAVVWVEAPEDLRLGRGLARDGDAMRAEWARWMELERSHFAREGTRDRADVVVDGTTPLQP